jgi:ribosomal protein S7
MGLNNKSLFLEKNIYNKLISLMLRCGKKGKAVYTVTNALNIIKKKIIITFSYLVWGLFKKLYTRIEVRKILIRGRTVQVPFRVTTYRQIYLATKWILMAVLENVLKISLKRKIADELFDLYLNKTNKIISYKYNNYKQALQNRANLHYRW